MLIRGSDEELTRITGWQPGHDTSAAGVMRHDFHERGYLLDGQLTCDGAVTHGSASSYRPAAEVPRYRARADN